MKGTISNVGSNFVEILVGKSTPPPSRDDPENHKDESSEEKAAKEAVDKDSVQKQPKKDGLCPKCQGRKLKDCRIVIFAINKIAYVKLKCSDLCRCTCH